MTQTKRLRKNFLILSIGALSLFSSFASAQEETPAVPLDTKVQEHPTVMGLYVGAGITEVMDSAGVSLGGRYWDEYFGGGASFGFSKTTLDSDTLSISDATEFDFSGELLLGMSRKNIKPYFALGFGYSYAKDDASDIKLTTFGLVPAIGVDIAVTDNFLIGSDLFAFPYILSGSAEDTSTGTNVDLDGFAVTFLKSIRVAYKF